MPKVLLQYPLALPRHNVNGTQNELTGELYKHAGIILSQPGLVVTLSPTFSDLSPGPLREKSIIHDKNHNHPDPMRTCRNLTLVINLPPTLSQSNRSSLAYNTLSPRSQVQAVHASAVIELSGCIWQFPTRSV